jgi:hypothetical protein
MIVVGDGGVKRHALVTTNSLATHAHLTRLFWRQNIFLMISAKILAKSRFLQMMNDDNYMAGKIEWWRNERGRRDEACRLLLMSSAYHTACYSGSSFHQLKQPSAHFENSSLHMKHKRKGTGIELCRNKRDSRILVANT